MNNREYALSIVVPTYNEKDNINALFERLDAALDNISYEVVFVDDSSDNTPDIILELQKEHNNVQLFHRTEEKGLATAVLKGFSLAKGEYISVMDADLQHPPEIIAKMYSAINQGYDFCIPSRYVEGGSDGGLNYWRKFVSWSARVMGWMALKSLRKISDPTSGLFMFRRQCIDGADLRPIGWKIMVEVLAMADYSTVCEIPYVFCERNAGESKISTKVTLEYIEQLINLRKREMKDRTVTVKVLN